MKCFLPNFLSERTSELMRWFGYSSHREDDGMISFVRSSFAPEARFPRFHASVCPHDGGIQINVHLDQEDINGQGNHQFFWAYHNSLVFEECRRLESLADKARGSIDLTQPNNFLKSQPPKFSPLLFIKKILCKFF